MLTNKKYHYQMRCCKKVLHEHITRHNRLSSPELPFVAFPTPFVEALSLVDSASCCNFRFGAISKGTTSGSVLFHRERAPNLPFPLKFFQHKFYANRHLFILHYQLLFSSYRRHRKITPFLSTFLRIINPHLLGL